MVSSGLGEFCWLDVTFHFTNKDQESHMPNLLLWSLGFLAPNKSIQEKCYQPVIRQATLDDSVDLEKDHGNYLMAFVKEAG